MGTAETLAEQISVRLYCFPSSRDKRVAFVLLQPALIAKRFSVSILSDNSLKNDGLQLVSPPKTAAKLKPFIYRPSPDARSDPHDVSDVSMATVLGKSDGGLITLPKCDPTSFDHYVDFITGQETTLDEFCGNSPALRSCNRMLQHIGTLQSEQAIPKS